MAVERGESGELRFKHPERLLVVVIAFIFWGVGLLDLLGHDSRDTEILGRYSLPFFLFILAYAALGSVWLILFFNDGVLTRVVNAIRRIQNSMWPALVTLGGLALALWVILEWDRWARLPGLQFAAFMFVLLALALLLLTGGRRHWWQRAVAWPLLALLLLEAGVQAAASFGVLPGRQLLDGNYAPYGRIYNNTGSELINGYANRYGWTFPDVELDDANTRILIVGGSAVQALNVQPAQQLAAQLGDRLAAATADPPREVVAVGLTGFGLSPFIYDLILQELPTIMKVDELIVLVTLGDDFQSPAPGATALRYQIAADGSVNVHPDDARLRHDLTHHYLFGYEALQLVETLRNNVLTPRVLPALLGGGAVAAQSAQGVAFPRQVGAVRSSFALTEPGHAGIRDTRVTLIPDGNNFLFRQDEGAARAEALAVLFSLLREAHAITQANGTTLRVVTVPVFPAQFFAANAGDTWSPQLGDYDLLLPEIALTEFSIDNGIPIVPMGHYMRGLTPAQIAALYQTPGLSDLTPAGHATFAAAIDACFYAAPAADCLP